MLRVLHLLVNKQTVYSPKTACFLVFLDPTESWRTLNSTSRPLVQPTDKPGIGEGPRPVRDATRNASNAMLLSSGTHARGAAMLETPSAALSDQNEQGSTALSIMAVSLILCNAADKVHAEGPLEDSLRQVDVKE